MRGRREHVVGQPRRLGHRDVDDDDALQGLEGFPHLPALGQRVNRVGAFNEHRPVAVRMVGEDLVGDQVAGHEPVDHDQAAFGVLREFAQGGAGVEARQVVSLAATAVVEDGFAAEPVSHVRQPRRDLADRGVPVDLFEAAVGAPAHGRQQAVAAVLVVVEAPGLLADVALGDGVCPVTADAGELPSVVAAQLDLDAAVALAEDARGWLPWRGFRRRGVGLVPWAHAGS